MLEELRDFARIADQMVLDPERRNLASMTFKNEQFFRGLTRNFQQAFEGEKTEDFQKRLKPSANVTKRVVNAFLAAIYGNEVKRDFQDETNQKILQDIMLQNGNFLVDAMRWHKRAELSGLAYVIPRFDFDTEKFFINSYSADQIFPIPEPEDPFKLKAVVINFNIEDHMEGIHAKVHSHREVWTPDEFLVLRDDKVAVNAQGEDMHGEHEFKGIPGGFFRAEDDHENFFPVPPATDVRKMHEQLLEMLSTCAEVFRYQSFNILFFKNPNTSEVVVGPSKFMSTNNPEGDLKAVNFQADVTKLFAATGNFMEMIADLGEVPSFTLTNKASAESGLALSIKFMPHIQAVHRRVIGFKSAELKLWADFLRLSSMVGAAKPDLSDEALMGTVDFPDIPIPKSIDDETRQHQFDLNHGLTSPTQILRERNPEMTDKQADEEIRKNLAETMEFRRIRGDVPGASVEASGAAGLETGQAAAAEDNPASGVEA